MFFRINLVFLHLHIIHPHNTTVAFSKIMYLLLTLSTRIIKLVAANFNELKSEFNPAHAGQESARQVCQF